MKEPKIIFEDDWLIAVDKPPKLLVIPTPKKEKYTLGAIINSYLEKNNCQAYAYPAHRLDRETSGIILYAKGKSTQKKLMQLFKERLVKKTYIAFVQGRLEQRQGIINNRIFENNIAKTAITRYQVLKEYLGYSKVLIMPETGRTNQIRIHFKQIGHPLVGERRFAFAKDYKLKFRRVALHAQTLEFIHPLTKEYLKLYAPLAEDMKSLERNI